MEEFKWDDTHQRAFDQIKKYLSSPPVMMPLRKKWPMKLYLSATEESIGAMLAQENEAGSEQTIYYLSRVLTPVECRYMPIKKLCLALYFAAMKLRVYMLPVLVYIICQIDLIKYMLSRPLITGRIGKWALAIMEFNIAYVPQKAIKGRALAYFLADHPSPEIESQVFDELNSTTIFMTPWTLMFDGSSTSEGSGAGIVIISLAGNQISFSFFLDFRCLNNQAEYDALIIGLEILLEMAVKDVHIVGDSSLVVNQISEDFRCLNWQLRPFHSLATQLVNQFHNVTLEYRPRAMNKIANDLAQTASGIRVPNDNDDWRIPYILFLQHPTLEADRRTKRSAIDYVLMDGDLYKRSADDALLFQCISKFEGLKNMAKFLKQHIFHQFGLPETIVANNGSMFRANEVLQLGRDMQVKMVTLTPYYAQGNGQAEASNKVVIEIIEKMIKDKPRRWHETLSEALWAYRNLKRTSTGTTRYRLTFGHDAVLPMELNVKSARVALQHNFIPANYNETMLAKLKDLDEVQKLALDHLMIHKAKVMKAYNKRVKFKSFAECDMVWQTILPPGKVDRVYEKWSPTWKGPFVVHQVLHGGVYRLKDLNSKGTQQRST
ncbi:uncharacterized protein LOC132270347 [Cornus florida]|uniref:uncharacterized protein LOC132270347 n=1 Tax=Cornus florida TaxID=4283 RepID=UPI00289FA0EC|nr:uncharacterized protein LOC132270347 [Cornus florida]